MSTGRVWLDLTELVLNPLQTGIQRLERELIRHWPVAGQLLPCRYDVAADRFVALPAQVFDVLGARQGQNAGTTGEQRTRLLPLLENAPAVLFREGDVLLNPEVFFEPGRARRYEALASGGGVGIAWIIYDFVVYLRPQDYPQGAVRNCMHYLRAMRGIERVAFISEKTRDDYARIIRPADGAPVIPLGADGLGGARGAFAPGRRTYACLGTIEPRKNVALLLDVFREYWRQGGQATLTLAGRLDDRAVRETEMLAALAAEPRLHQTGALTDAAMRDVLEAARATFYLSEFEGFGIPPLESLHAGVPVVVQQDTPSIAGLPPDGQIRLGQVTRDGVATSLMRLEDDAEMAQLWSGAARLSLQTWRQAVERIAAWTNG